MTSDRLARPATSFLVLALLLAAGAVPVHGGTNVWTPIGPPGGLVFAVAIDPLAPGTVYAGTVGGVFKSLDGGASWTLRSRGLTDRATYTLAVDPRHPTHLFAGSALGGLYRSTDGAATWQAVAGTPKGISAIAVAPESSATVYAATFFHGFWRSDDGGQTWQERSDRSLLFESLLADPRHPGTLYAGTGNGGVLSKSTDGGDTWVDASAGLPPRQDVQEGVRLAFDPEAPRTMYIAYQSEYGFSAHLFVSRDGGAHWRPAGPGGLPLATGPGGLVYAGRAKSVDHGRTWTAATLPPAAADEFGFVAAAGPVSSPTGELYAGTDSGTYKSVDGGSTWQPIVNGLNATSVTALAVRPVTPTLVYAGVDGLGLLRGRPSGQFRLTLPQSAPERILFDPADPAAVYAALPYAIARSADGGLSWESVELPEVESDNPHNFRAFAAGPGTLYVGIDGRAATAASGCNVFKSVDRGASWTCLPLRAPGVRSLAVAPTAPAVVYATETANLWKSTDGGATWTALNRGWRRLATSLDIAVVDPTDANVLYLASNAGLLKSVDGGRNWTTAGKGLPAGTIDTVVVDPSAPATIYAGIRSQGVYRSVDGGRRWFPQVGGLQGFSGALAIDPLHPETLYAGTPANGVYSLTIVP